MNKPTTIVFNYDTHVKELTERFGRLIKQLGPNNKKDWSAKPEPVASVRYEFEVDFAYALHDLKVAPLYLQGKIFDQASGIVSVLISHLKQQKGGDFQADAT